MKKQFLLSLSMLLISVLAFAQNPIVKNGVATYTTDKNIGKKFEVPASWDKIIIKENVTLTGSFYMPTRKHPIEIAGEDRYTSIIQGDGSRPTDDFNSNGEPLKGRTYSAIRADKSPDIYVHDLTITKPMKFHIHGGFGNVTVERCEIIAGSETHTTDGIHGGKGKTVVKDCYIDVYDDALYTIECKLVENTTIVHNANGGPFMTSWGADVPKDHTCIVRNCTVIGNSIDYYAHGVFSWAQKKDDFAQTVRIKFEGTFDYKVNPGKVAAPMYTIARPGKDKPIVRNATILIDGECPFKNRVELRPTAVNSKVVFTNCGNNTTPPTLISDITDLKVIPSCDQAELSWTDVSSEEAYRIRRAENGGSFIVLKDVPADTDFFVDETVVADNSYKYQVRPMQGGKAVKVSNQVTVTIEPCIREAPISDIIDLEVIPSCDQAELSWTDVSSEEAYRIRRAENGSSFIVLKDVAADTDFFVDETVVAGNSYKYQVRPMQGGKAVKVSNQVTVSIQSCVTEPKPVDTFIKAYPNPTSGVINMPEVYKNDQLKVVNQTTGNVVINRTIAVSGSTKVDITTQPAGSYVIQIVRNNELLTRLIQKL